MINRQVVHLSALTGEGLENLTAAILEPFGSSRFGSGRIADHRQQAL